MPSFDGATATIEAPPEGCKVSDFAIHLRLGDSDNGTGAIVGWSFNHQYQNDKMAMDACQKKGGQNPKVVARF